MQNNFKWRFPRLDGGRVQGINNSGISTFNGKDLYENLAREICQNSLDAAYSNPVTVKFELKNLPKEYYPIKSLEEVINRCDAFGKEHYSDEKFKEFIEDAKKCLSNERIPILIISDYNTKGLDGSKNESGAWLALTSSDGVTSKNDGSGGSYGIGKNAPFACSRLRSVFYSTYCKLEETRALQGVASLVTHLNEDGEKTQGFGFFYNVRGDKNHPELCPIFDQECLQFPDFYRKDYGTDVIILGFHTILNWEKVIKKAIIENFFEAILSQKLIVKIGEEQIDDSNIDEIIEILLQDMDEESSASLIKSRNYIKIIKNKENIQKFKILEENDLTLMIGLDDNYTRTVAYIRGTGMLIRSRPKKKMKAYEAIVIVNDNTNLNNLLKRTEPPKHNEWDPALIGNDKDKETAQKAINKINRYVNNYIDKFCTIENGDSVDPDDIATWLPDDESSADEQQHGDNGQKIEKLTITSIRVKEPAASSSKKIGNVGYGKETEGSQHKHTPRAGTGDKHLNPGSGEFGTQRTVNPSTTGAGERSLHLKSINNLRLLPISIDHGIYKLILTPSEDFENIYFTFFANRDDGGSEQLVIKGISEKGTYKNINNKKIGPFSLKKNDRFLIQVTLDFRERALITVGGIVYEADR